jgi:hypothetical protein
MGDLLKLIRYAVAGLFRSRAALQTEVLALRHQLNVLRRRALKRVAVSNIDRMVFAGLYHLAPEVVKIRTPETIIRWHRAGFRAWWRWKSRPRGGRPRTPDEIRQLIHEMSVANPLWGANAEWLARQLTEACGWDEPPLLIRDRDGAYGAAFIRRIRAMGIRARPVSARSP